MTQIIAQRRTPVDARKALQDAEAMCLEVAKSALVRTEELGRELKEISGLAMLSPPIKQEFEAFAAMLASQTTRIGGLVEKQDATAARKAG